MINEEQNRTPTDEFTIKKSKLKWSVLTTFAVLFIGMFFLWEPFDSSKPESKEGFHRDEETSEQVLNKDYTFKIQQMLDSGMSVAEMSRETGLRKDVIRKIKKGKHE